MAWENPSGRLASYQPALKDHVSDVALLVPIRGPFDEVRLDSSKPEEVESWALLDL